MVLFSGDLIIFRLSLGGVEGIINAKYYSFTFHAYKINNILLYFRGRLAATLTQPPVRYW